MTDIPIIFSAPMVRALLDGRKTMTRRIARVVRKSPPGQIGGSDTYISRTAWCSVYPGDRLWVRESFRPVHSGDPSRGATYRADVNLDQTKWKPSIHMPRWASRLTLIVSAAKIERLQAISEADAIAEGVEPIFDHGTGNSSTHVIAFEHLWCSLHGSNAWLANPEVVALSFSVIKANIDANEPAFAGEAA